MQGIAFRGYTNAIVILSMVPKSASHATGIDKLEQIVKRTD